MQQHQQPQNLQLLQASNLEIDDDSDDDLSDLDLQQGYRRPKLVVDTNSDHVSDYVAIRLGVSREKAMQKYREIYTQA